MRCVIQRLLRETSIPTAIECRKVLYIEFKLIQISVAEINQPENLRKAFNVKVNRRLHEILTDLYGFISRWDV